MLTVTSSEFKLKCLQLMDKVNQTQEEIVITKNGKPVSRLLPARQELSSLYGINKSLISSHDDLITPVSENWNAEK